MEQASRLLAQGHTTAEPIFKGLPGLLQASASLCSFEPMWGQNKKGEGKGKERGRERKRRRKGKVKEGERKVKGKKREVTCNSG